jgi:glutamate 5-kinase
LAAVTPELAQFRRVVLKVGSALLVDRARGRLNHAWLAALAEDIAEIHGRGADVLVVSSGAIALGRTVLGLPAGALRLEDSQAAAAVGQIALARIWSEVLAHHRITAGQILVTLADTEERRRYLNARATTLKLLDLRAVPVVNENDTVATSEIRYGDNDRLAARVATMIGADLLVLFSDVDGLYTAPPSSDPAARHIPVVERITPAIEAMAGGAGSDLSRGGMRTKIEAGKIAAAGGTHMVIADGRAKNPLRSVAEGGRCTWFLTPSNPNAARKTWIAGALEPRGTLKVDDGAARALRSGASLLAVGVRRVEGVFSRGDAVTIRDAAGVLGRGLVAYDAEEATRIIGRPSREIEAILGYPGRAEMVHRDDMALSFAADPDRLSAAG